MNWVVLILVFGGVTLYFMTEDQRARLWRACLAVLERAAHEVRCRLTRQSQDGEEMPPLPLATCAVVLVNLWVFGGMLFGPDPLGEPKTLLSWGASFGPRTTNGEWWRLVTATFVHDGRLHMLAALAGLIQIGCLTERIVGRLAFVLVYLSAGAAANLVALSKSPVEITAGDSGAILGVYGLLAATWIWNLLRRSRIRIPWRTVKRLAPGVALFLVYIAATHRLDRSAAVAACAGAMIQGFLLATGAREHKPGARRIAMLVADTAALLVLLAVPLRGMADVMPAIARVMAMEDRTTKTYEAAIARFRRGSIPAVALAQVIDSSVLPDLQAARAGIAALERVPREHQPLVAAADEYLRLRDDSWRLRSRALRKSAMPMLKEADLEQSKALEALGRIRNPDRQ